MNPIAIVYRKELCELRRDWRAMLSIIVVPVLIVPILILGVVKIASQLNKEKPKVMLLGGQNSPTLAEALRRLDKFNLVPASPDYTNLLSNKKIRAAVEIPKDFDADVEAERTAAVRIYDCDGQPESMLAAQQLQEFFQRRREETVRRRLLEHSLPQGLITPFEVQRANVASPRQVTGTLLGMILPYVMVVMCLAGAIYPAIDLTAGEKERGTLETLLSCPAARTHLVLGKGLVVLTVSLATAALSISSNGVALLFIGTGRMAKLPLALDPLALAGSILVMIPLAIFLSSLAVAAGLFARSAKEANTYLQPMLLLAIIPAIVAALPGIDFNYALGFVPVLNMSLLCKELLAGRCYWGHVLAVLGSMSVYAALAVAAAVALFKRENVIFRT